MSIRSLTESLKDEAREARRREAVARLAAGSDGNGTSPPEAMRGDPAHISSGVVSMSRAPSEGREPSDGVLDEVVATTRAPFSVGFRPRQPGGRWNPPGGIAARFSLRAATDHDIGKPADLVDAEASREPATETGADASSEGRRGESPPAGDTTPITIELESHQESAD
ncbi:MAG: hypothetical protein QGI83_01325 [Candidatus Latescibacteria bacterium]|nr:hypothetical protein [Candidatus Latescibacterota bacterium]